ncbi:coiled-coil domain-containing protein 32 [Equus asinus]|uniref:Coiled-coil domain containing 32 n=2 Tax=Equus asinus TaxID=9793 RepID=A0A9L0J1L3_EQUAS|nr:coiled-coil domain-containing protein 32 isoform X1 [Equus asinus]XP_014696233.1 coiled-coil domain-containing protein 32 isoform X1 [Equus asinus]XP_014696234.1 coiled-coil domain-containing protein 32 isoform X1 [Equus asinus]XP_014696236.1 coiled-coil domain-containing protein 32 isoform X1 [Equus asinus]XP_014696238.1 coiled-coil domain-containing protein 32 isoform X1 [Equus asinus]XP_044621080.1 coiled-coil domain-containing protein 32 isoform X1 [Equus asinus]XP_046511074.1 coiled-c
MKMFESIDSTTTRSGPDLWAEICPCLPNPDQEDGANTAFSDSFVDSYPAAAGQRASDFAVQPAVKPWTPLQDSEVYLASLEKKLRRIKGLNQEVTSKDMLRTLAQAKKECWDRFLQEKLASEFFVDGLDSDESTLEHFKRWLQPDKVAISTEEVQYLIPPESQVEKPAAGDEPAGAEQ